MAYNPGRNVCGQQCRGKEWNKRERAHHYPRLETEFPVAERFALCYNPRDPPVAERFDPCWDPRDPAVAERFDPCWDRRDLCWDRRDPPMAECLDEVC